MSGRRLSGFGDAVAMTLPWDRSQAAPALVACQLTTCSGPMSEMYRLAYEYAKAVQPSLYERLAAFSTN